MRKHALLVTLCSFGGTGLLFLNVAQADVTSTTDAVTTSTSTQEISAGADAGGPLILQMGDGRFYNPTSGQTANSREALLQLLTGAVSPSPVTSTVETPPVIATPMPVTSTQAAPPSSPSPILQDFPLKNAIARAKDLLEQQMTAEGVKDQTVSSRPSWAKVRLAIWDSVTDQVVTTDILKNGDEIKRQDDHFAGSIKVKRANGINSQFTLDSQGRYMVVAIRYPIYTDISTSRRHKKFKEETVVYTPYSSNLQTPEMVSLGRQILTNVITDVYQTLQENLVHSRAFPDELMTGVVDPSLAKTIAVIEHVDQAALERDANGTVDAFFVTLAANPDAAYAYSRSSANALGLVQFIPSTYKLLVNRRPELHLNPNFTEGMQDLHNSVLAQIAYLDDILASLPADVQAQYKDSTQRPRVNEYIAAAYNGGEARVKKAIAQWDDLWTGERETQIATLTSQHQQALGSIKSLKSQIKKTKDAKTKKSLQTQLTKTQSRDNAVVAQLNTLKNTGLKKETLGYIAKYRKVINVIEGSTVVLAQASS